MVLEGLGEAMTPTQADGRRRGSMAPRVGTLEGQGLEMGWRTS